ncbi:MAG: hypothetical protein J0L94_14850 [Rhodothermia bacterium]|nr:hypothetical protein [Rhodothermia bacterium]
MRFWKITRNLILLTWVGLLSQAKAQTLQAPLLIFPELDAQNQSTLPLLDWSDVSEALRYEIQISTRIDFLADVIPFTTSDATSRLAPKDLAPKDLFLKTSTLYFWRVRSIGTNNVGSNWSEVRSFTTTFAQLITLQQAKPLNNAVDVRPADDFLTWNKASGATQYLIQYGETNVAAFRWVHEVGNTDQIRLGDLPNIKGNRTYKWRVIGYSNQIAGNWSDTWTFSTGPDKPDTPLMLSPENEEDNVILIPEFKWFVSTGAERYQLQVSQYPNFPDTSLAVNISTTSDRYRPIFGLKKNTLYYWRIWASNQSGDSPVSATRSFTTGSLLPAPTQQAQLLLPADKASDQLATVVFSWLPVQYAEGYVLEIDGPALGQGIRDTFTETYGSPRGQVLPLGQVFTWRIKAFNRSGFTYSETRSFSTGSAPLLPVLLTPESGSLTNLNPILAWQTQGSGVSFEFQLGLDVDFTSPLLPITPMTNTAFPLNALPYDKTYFWRVRAINDFGKSNWVVRSFTTIPERPPKPELVTPVNNHAQESTSPTLQWNVALRATSYALMYAPSSDFSEGILLPSTSLLSATLQGLEAGRTYFWRVKAANLGGEGEWSDVWAFTVKLAAPILTAPKTLEVVRGTETDLIWNVVANTTRYQYQVSEVQDFASITTEGSTLTTTVRISSLKPHTAYYVRIKAENQKTDSPWSEIVRFFAYPKTITISVSKDFPEIRRSKGYRLIGLPGQGIATAQSGFGDLKPTREWKVFRDTGGDGTYSALKPTDVLETGKGYWAIGRENWQIASVQTASVVLSPDRTYSLALVSGWNLITNPFDIPVQWVKVKAANGLTKDLLRFENGSFLPDDTLQPYSGYYFLNDQNLTSLRIPYPPAAETVLPLEPNGINLSFSSEAGERAFLQIQEGNTPENKDAQPLPTSSFVLFEAAIVRPNQPKVWSETRKIAEGAFFPIEVRAAAGTMLTLRATFGNVGAVLRNPATDERWTLATNRPIRFLTSNEVQRLELWTGNTNFLAEQAFSETPASFRVFANFPNPFEHETRFGFTLPTHLAVRVTISNVLGQKIRLLAENAYEAGWHEVFWDGRDANGHRMPGGIYFATIEAGAMRKTIQMTKL